MIGFVFVFYVCVAYLFVLFARLGLVWFVVCVWARVGDGCELYITCFVWPVFDWFLLVLMGDQFMGMRLAVSPFYVCLLFGTWNLFWNL